jgi:hypothetical protein
MTDTQGKVVVIEPKFKLVPFEQLKPGTEPAYLIKGLVPRVGLTVVWGPPKCGKSFWTTDAMLHVALGWEYRGRKVIAGPVVYCAFEGAEGYGKRAEAFRLTRLPENAEAVAFFLVAARMNFAVEHEELIRAIRLTLGEKRPVAVVLDTLNRSLEGSEGKDEDMAKYVRAGDAIREAFGCAVLVVHHCGIDASRPRGHTSLTGAADAQLAVRRDTADNIVVEVEWMKDGPEGQTVISRLKSVEVGLDDDHEPISSCIVESVEGDAARVVIRGELPARQKLALEALAHCATIPAPASFNLPLGFQVAKVDAWRDELFSRGILERDAANPRQDFKRLKESLQAKHLIQERNSYAWPSARSL